ncbi:TonB-dependent receptor [Sphingomonas sp. C8-2]|jgi:outer membrane receptor protein involved in Fe transport|uniref:Outer membrane receptor proteins, mostly Fe transport n=1 Tax=Rhizorhabdus histidinilytica TaxID=439228 RepID=A0A1T5FY85_9SPHN|nr:TonB-dependent receptor [Rhizorhabdus histidinilytica]QEH81401.1 TonB-dependent receptor [Sphingomonas sp. C8-2]SKC01141.1 Outer membrane receptor proteins, mostly Fe transport [Rhizorhabdus histidinilytica]
MQPTLAKSISLPVLLAIGASAVALAAPARAQDAVAAGDASEGGDIVVTARKARERLQDVPISVNALSGDQLRDRGAVDVKDVLRSVPGLSFSGTERGLGNYNIRGISTVASAPTVGIYLDDISLVTIATTFSGAFDPVFFDMERLEVLKGPQGTLYGGSSMGGAIKYVSARPKLDEVGGSAAAGVATTAHGSMSYNAEAVVNLPIVQDVLAVRGGIYFRHDGGYIDNVAGGSFTNSRYSSTEPGFTPQRQNALSTRSASNQNDANTYVGRLSLLWQPDESWSIRPAAFYQHYKLDNPGQFFLGEKKLTSSYRIAQPTTDKAGIYSLDINKELGGVQATSLTAYFDRKLDYVRDYSFFIGGLVPPLLGLTSDNLSASRTKTFSQEFRLASTNSDAPLTWIAGLYYSHQDDNLYQIATTPGATPVIGTEVGYVGDTTTITKQYAAFGEATYKLLDNLDVTAGVRLFQIKQVVDIMGDGPFNGGLTQVIGRRSNEKGINPKFGISYKVTRDNLIYASAAKGFRPGGPNRFQINPVLCAADLNQLGLSKAPDTFDSDNLWSYELGTKNQFGNIMFNGALFYTDWKKIQQQINLTSCGFAFTGNAGAAHVKGAEAEARINLTRAFQVGGTATYSDAKIVEAVPGTTAEDGDQVLAVPKWMLSGYASYGAELIEGWRGQIRGEYQYQSRSRRQFNRTLAILYPSGAAGTTPNRAEFRGAYQVVNAFASISDGETEFRLYINNLFDNRPFLDTDLTAGVDRSTTIRPRTIGLEVRRRF